MLQSHVASCKAATAARNQHVHAFKDQWGNPLRVGKLAFSPMGTSDVLKLLNASDTERNVSTGRSRKMKSLECICTQSKYSREKRSNKSESADPVGDVTTECWEDMNYAFEDVQNFDHLSMLNQDQLDEVANHATSYTAMSNWMHQFRLSGRDSSMKRVSASFF